MTEKFSPWPWSRDQFGNVVGATNRKVSVQGVSLPLTKDDEAEANADLFAAAPQMYEALQAIEIALKTGIGSPHEILDENSPIRDAIRDSLKQARGEK